MRIGIVGLGLIGGSLGIDFSQQGYQVVGIGRRPEVCQAALERNVVQQAGCDYSLLSGVDAVFVCTPIAAIAATVGAIAPYLAPHAVVTDVGSVKAAIVTAATHHWPRFVGGHPMAGKTEVGLEAAEPGLYRDRAYVLTPLAQTPADAVETVAALVKELRARLYQCSPEIHDRAVAWISHLPVMVSSSLIQACLSEPNAEVAQLARALASSGFQDTSRVGGGPPELGLMMARYNRDSILQSLQGYRHQLDQVIALIQAEDWEGVQQHLRQTQAARSEFIA
ncbi:MAG: prephenate/arogenate dehydrogenase [Cyanobacteria bacterium Co-bin13]|nr:prephenate/arogenate dehydrogenase [Cyanobacteria bacterium Co-bin13]